MSEQAGKKTLAPEHVVTALQQLGFDDFVTQVEAYWQQVKEDAQVNDMCHTVLRSMGLIIGNRC